MPMARHVPGRPCTPTGRAGSTGALHEAPWSSDQVTNVRCERLDLPGPSRMPTSHRPPGSTHTLGKHALAASVFGRPAKTTPWLMTRIILDFTRSLSEIGR